LATVPSELICVSAGRPTATVLELNDDAAIASVVADGAVQAKTVMAAPQRGGRALSQMFSQIVAPPPAPLLPACQVRTSGRCTESYAAYRLAELRRELTERLYRCEDVASKGAVAKGRGRGSARVDVSAPHEPQQFTLPDGRVVSAPDADVTSPSELLFAVGGVAAAGEGTPPPPPLHGLVLGAIGAAEAELHKELLRSVVVTGHVACLAGVAERFEHELAAATRAASTPSIAQQAHRLTIFIGSTHERRHGAWLGASILGSLTSHHEMWMSRAEYDEFGAALITRKGMQFAW
jgi:actin-related protein